MQMLQYHSREMVLWQLGIIKKDMTYAVRLHEVVIEGGGGVSVMSNQISQNQMQQGTTMT